MYRLAGERQHRHDKQQNAQHGSLILYGKIRIARLAATYAIEPGSSLIMER